MTTAARGTGPADIGRTVDAVWRIESARLIAGLTRFTRGDLAQAEDLAQDALLQALERWPETGVPDRPGAWLMTTAKHRAIDLARRRALGERKHEELGVEMERHGASVAPEPDVAAMDDEIGDDLLSLVFTTCHPVLTTESRLALTLRMLGGLTTDEIARAFLVPSATVGQRISRAKATLQKAKVPFEVPAGDGLRERLASVLEVVYLIFNEGYSATAGGDWMRPALMEDAMRLGRILAQLAPDEPEVHGLVALMEIQASRNRARVDPDGEPVLLLEQDRGRWDHMLIRRGLAALGRAQALGGGMGWYALQAAIAACHARARAAEETDWTQLAALYTALLQVAPSPVVELNRAVAVGRAATPEEGLALLEPLAGEPSMKAYHLLPAVRGDLLELAGRREEAAAEFLRAADLTRNDRERGVLLARAAANSSGT